MLLLVRSKGVECDTQSSGSGDNNIKTNSNIVTSTDGSNNDSRQNIIIGPLFATPVLIFLQSLEVRMAPPSESIETLLHVIGWMLVCELCREDDNMEGTAWTGSCSTSISGCD